MEEFNTLVVKRSVQSSEDARCYKNSSAYVFTTS